MVDFTGYANKVLLSDTFDFTIDEVTTVLRNIGLINEKNICREEQMEKYIFLYGDEQEVYNREERKFIEGVGNIFIYREFHKKTKRGTMPCRVIAAEIETIEPIKSSVFFMKEINKAIGGYTVFFIKANSEFYIGMRLFGHNVKEDCMLSGPIVTCEDMEEICDRLMFVPDCYDFVSYYSAMASALEYMSEKYEDYDAQIIKRRGIQYPYLEMLSDIEKIFGLSVSKEKIRYYDSFEMEPEKNFLCVLKETYSELNFIESFKANTVEMLFEAEEMAQLAARTEEEHNLFLANHQEEEIKEYDSEIKDYLDDPEMMIKLLKKKKNL